MKLRKRSEAMVHGGCFAQFTRHGCHRDRHGIAAQTTSRVGLLAAVCLLVSCVHAGEPASDPRWTQPGPIPEQAPERTRTRRRIQIEVGVMVSPGTDTRVLRETADGAQEEKRLQAGDKVYVNDRIVVGATSQAELTMGQNVRLHIGAGSALRVLDKLEYPAKDKTGVVTQRNIEMTDGSARVRVRKNEIAPSPVLVVSGDVRLMLFRSDAVVQRSQVEKSETAGKGANTLILLRGNADVRLKRLGARGWEETGSRIVSARNSAKKIEVPDGKLESIPDPQEIKATELDAITAKMGFTVDDNRKRRPPPKASDRELAGP